MAYCLSDWRDAGGRAEALSDSRQLSGASLSLCVSVCVRLSTMHIQTHVQTAMTRSVLTKWKKIIIVDT